MAKRDVELVIRAKNEATKSIESVADALKVLTDIQDDVQKSAGKTGGLLDQLGNELKKLNAESKGLEALSKVAGNINKASDAVGRLESELAGTSADLARLKNESNAAASATNNLRQQIEAEAAALAKQKAAQAAARAEQTAANREVRAAEASINRLITRIAAAKKPNDDLAASLKSQQEALVALKAKQAEATAGYQKQVNATKTLQTSFKGLQAAASAAANNQKALEASAATAATAFERQSKGVNEAKADLASMQGIAATAAQALGAVAVSEDKIAAASKNAAIALTAVNEALSRQKASGATASPQGANLVTLQYKAQVEAVDRAKAAYAAASVEATKLGQALKTAAAPTAELQRAFLLGVTAAKAAKAEYLGQADALNRLRGVTQGTLGAFVSRTSATVQAARADREATNTATGLAGVLRALAQAFNGVGAAAASSGSRVNGIRGAFSAFYGESRQALSLFQRIRGELLGLSAQYVGLYAAISNIGGVITSYQTLEAAQNRLGAVFNQDSNKIAGEIQFLQGQAARLGIEFGTLANEYSKFAIAADAANFSSETTRKVFLSVAEAARVNKLSLDDTKGVFLALQQIISKGKVSSEELRRQLGDRLPGAFNIFADAIGMTTAELDKALQKGEVFATQDTLLKFADELTSRFGSQLPKALETVTTEIGKFQNNIANAQRQVAEGGFIEALRVGLQGLNQFFQSQEGAQFFTTLGAALGKFVTIIAEVPKYFDLIGTAIKLIIGYKFAQVIGQMAASFTNMSNTTLGASRALTTFGGNMRATVAASLALQRSLQGVGLAGFAGSLRGITSGLVAVTRASTVARGVFIGLAGSIRGIFLALGGLPGILLTIVSILATNLFANWATDVDTATTALTEHERIMAAVAETYEGGATAIDDAGKALKNVSLAQANQNFIDLTNSAAAAFAAFKEFDASKAIGRATLTANPEVEAIKALVRQAQSGEITVTSFRAKLAELNKTLQSREAVAYGAEIDKLAEKFTTTFQQAADGGAVAKQLGSTLEGTAQAFKIVSEAAEASKKSTDDSAKSFTDNVAAAQAFNEAINKLREDVPSLKKEIEETKKFVDLLTDAFNAMKAALATDGLRAFGDALSGIATGNGFQVLTALSAIASGDFSKIGQVLSTFGQGAKELTLGKIEVDNKAIADAIEAAANKRGVDPEVLKLIAKIESNFNPNAQNPNSSAGGLFQFIDDTARALGLQNRFDVVEASDAAARLTAENIRALTNAIGRAPTPAEIYLAHQQGAGTAAKLLANPNANAAGLIGSKQVTLNGGTLDMTAQEFVNLWIEKVNKYATGDAAGNKIVDQNAKPAEDRAKAEREINESIAKRIQDNTFEFNQISETARQQAINKALYDAENEAKAKGVTLTQQQKDQLIQTTGALFDAQNKEKQAALEKEQIEARVNQLYALRKELQEQITFAGEQGQTDKVAVLQQQLTDTDNKLKEAIIDAQNFYANMTGPEADLAKAKLDGMSNSLVEIKQGFLDAKAVNDLLISGLSTAFSSVAESIAGVISGTMSLKEGLAAVGQAFLKFAADFLLQLGQMIVKQALLNALTGAGGGGGIGGFLSGLFHRGGVVGQGGAAKRRVNPAWFNNAPRMHTGGVAGLKPGEIPAILKKNEEVLTETDPRNVLNGGLSGQGAGSASNVKIVNTFDAASVLSEALSTKAGEKAILNYVRSNPGAFKAALNG